MNGFVNGFLFLLVATGAYITFSSSWNEQYRAVLFLHPASGVIVALFFIPYIVSHYRSRHKTLVRHRALFFIFLGVAIPLFLYHYLHRSLYLTLGGTIFGAAYLRFTWNLLRLPSPVYQRAAVLVGQVLLLLFTALFVTGLLMMPGAGHSTGLILWHRYIGFLFAGLYALHLVRFMYSLRTQPLVLLRTRMAYILPCVLALAALVFFYHGKSKKAGVMVPVDVPLSLSGKPLAKIEDVTQMQATRSCGATDACHKDIVDHYVYSNHFRSPETPHFKKIVTLLESERGKESARFCFSCHAPHQAVARDLKENEKGIACTVCHTLSQAHLKPFGKETQGRKGFVMTLNTAHLSMFQNADADGKLHPMNDYLIRLNPLGHGRVFMPRLIKTDDFCLSCHQEHIPPLEKEDVVRARCVECHMKIQTSFVQGKRVKKAHYFAGANVTTPFVLGDKKTYGIVRSWLTGYFKSQVVDSYWELREAAGDPPSKATWLVTTMEPLTPPVPGKTCRVKILTSNPGILHPFPTGVLDLYDIWMHFKVKDEKGNVFYENGKPHERPYEKVSTHFLGGYFYDREGSPILKHRIWEKKGANRRWVKPGKTIEDIFTFPVPSSLKKQKYVVVEATWMYGRLNRDFMMWAYGRDMNFPQVPMVSITQRIPLEPGT